MGEESPIPRYKAKFSAQGLYICHAKTKPYSISSDRHEYETAEPCVGMLPHQ